MAADLEPVTETGEGDKPTENARASTVRVDRRRPGRTDDLSPELVRLFRAPEFLAADRDDRDSAERPSDDLDAARGIAMSLLLTAPFWLAVGLLLIWL